MNSSRCTAAGIEAESLPPLKLRQVNLPNTQQVVNNQPQAKAACSGKPD